MTNPKPCPLCDGTNITIDHCEEECCGALPRFVECECGLMLAGDWRNDEQAVAAWNSRPGERRAWEAGRDAAAESIRGSNDDEYEGKWAYDTISALQPPEDL